MAAINFKREWFTPKDEDGNLSFSTQESRINEAIAALNPGDWIELEDGTKCTTSQEIRDALFEKKQRKGNEDYVTCPRCGALGRVGQPCAFCDATIPMPKKDTSIKGYTIPVVSKQTVSAEEFANKISKYDNVGSWFFNMSKVSIGKLEGVINRNGDLVIPLNYNLISIDDARFLRIEGSVYDIEKQIFYKGIIWGNNWDDRYKNLYRFKNAYVHSGLDGNFYIKYFGSERYEINGSAYYIDISFVRIFGKDLSIIAETKEHGSIKPCPEFNCYLSPYQFVSNDGVVKVLDSSKMKMVYDEEKKVIVIKNKINKSEIIVKPSEDLSAAIDSAKELYDKEQISAQQPQRTINNKQGAGCVILLLPLLALGTGATFGIIELIKRIFL